MIMNKKTLLSFLLCIVLATAVVSAQDDIYTYDELTLEQTITNTIDITKTDNDFKVSYLDAFLHLFPENDYRQLVLDSHKTPQPEEINNSLRFRWEHVMPSTLEYESTYTIRTTNNPYPISNKIPFPVEDIPEDLAIYLETTDFINIDQDIQNLATELAQGHDDLFLLQHELGSWITENIEYNLSTITAEANIPSTTVLRQRYGVCDELTNLFISLNRALGIPARFVSGIAYSDSILFDEKWGNHGWAEVYFPEVGWVPYDVTYGQYGFIDATHIALSKRVDGSQPAVNYYAFGRGFTFTPASLDFDTKLIDKKSSPLNPTTITIEMQETDVGFDSYNLVKATIQNNLDGYYVEELYLGQTENLEILNDDRFTVALEPGESKEVSWLLKVNSRLDKGFIYTFPVILLDSRYDEFKTEFSVREQSETYGKTYMEQYAATTTQTTSDKIDVGCSAPQQVEVNKPVIITCSAAEDVRACLGENCHVGTQATFSVTESKTGIKTKRIIITQDGEQNERFVTYRVFDKPKINIDRIEFPETIAFGEVKPLTMYISKDSASNPEDVTITITHDFWNQVWDVPVIDQDKSFELRIGSKSLRLKENDITISITYHDDKGNTYTTTQDIQIYLEANSFGEKVKVFFGNLAFWIDHQLKKATNQQ